MNIAKRLASLALAFIAACTVTLGSSSLASAQDSPPDGLSTGSTQGASETDPNQRAAPLQFNTRGDYVHISSSAPRTASAHGWWERVESTATEADVTVQLQVLNSGNWVNVGPPATRRIAPGTYRRANARWVCQNTLNVNWRSVIDVDLVGYVDSSEKLYTTSRLLQCGA